MAGNGGKGANVASEEYQIKHETLNEMSVEEDG